MKAFDYNSKNWTNNKPKKLSDTDFAKAIKAYELALDKLKTDIAKFPESYQNYVKANSALDEVESERKKLIKTAKEANDSKFTDCINSLNSADYAAQAKYLKGAALNKFNEIIIDGVKEYTSYKSKVGEPGAMLEKANSILKTLQSIDDKKILALDQLTAGALIKKCQPHMWSKSDGVVSSSLLAKMGTNYPQILIKKSVFQKDFPTVYTDLDKLDKAVNEYKENEEELMSVRTQVYTSLQKIIDKFNKEKNLTLDIDFKYK